MVGLAPPCSLTNESGRRGGEHDLRPPARRRGDGAAPGLRRLEPPGQDPRGGNEVLYAGYRHDPETGYYHVRGNNDGKKCVNARSESVRIGKAEGPLAAPGRPAGTCGSSGGI